MFSRSCVQVLFQDHPFLLKNQFLFFSLLNTNAKCIFYETAADLFCDVHSTGYAIIQNFDRVQVKKTKQNMNIL